MGIGEVEEGRPPRERVRLLQPIVGRGEEKGKKKLALLRRRCSFSGNAASAGAGCRRELPPIGLGVGIQPTLGPPPPIAIQMHFMQQKGEEGVLKGGWMGWGLLCPAPAPPPPPRSVSNAAVMAPMQKLATPIPLRAPFFPNRL